jgi:hypothetical protein
VVNVTATNFDQNAEVLMRLYREKLIHRHCTIYLMSYDAALLWNLATKLGRLKLWRDCILNFTKLKDKVKLCGEATAVHIWILSASPETLQTNSTASQFSPSVILQPYVRSIIIFLRIPNTSS